MFKNTLNAPPKEPKPKRQKKQKRSHNYTEEEATYVQDNNISFAQNEEIEDGDDDFDVRETAKRGKGIARNVTI